MVCWVGPSFVIWVLTGGFAAISPDRWRPVAEWLPDDEPWRSRFRMNSGRRRSYESNQELSCGVGEGAASGFGPSPDQKGKATNGGSTSKVYSSHSGRRPSSFFLRIRSMRPSLGPSLAPSRYVSLVRRSRARSSVGARSLPFGAFPFGTKTESERGWTVRLETLVSNSWWFGSHLPSRRTEIKELKGDGAVYDTIRIKKIEGGNVVHSLDSHGTSWNIQENTSPKHSRPLQRLHKSSSLRGVPGSIAAWLRCCASPG